MTFDRITEEIRIREAKKASRATTAGHEPAGSQDLEASFKKLGLSESAAKIAARGRGPQGARSLTETGKGLGLSPAAAAVFARGRGGAREAIVKNVAGLTAKSFAWPADPEDPTTWRLQIARSEDTGADWSPDEDLVRAAVAQLPGNAGYGKELAIPAADLPAVVATLAAAWIACGASVDEMPAVLTQEPGREALEAAGKRLGLSGRALEVFVEGRRR
jgi:hypothetical protein